MSDQPLQLILLEDDEVDAMAVDRALRDQGVGLTVYPTAVEALRDPRLAGDSQERVLVLVDLNLPGMGGLEFLARLRQRCPGGHPPALVLTTSADRRDHDTALHHGVAGYFIKPIDPAELRDLMAAIVAYWSRSLPRV